MKTIQLNRSALRTLGSIAGFAAASVLSQSCGSSGGSTAAPIVSEAGTGTTCTGSSCTGTITLPGAPGTECSLDGYEGVSETSNTGVAMCRVEFPAETIEYGSNYTSEETLDFSSSTVVTGGGIQTGIAVSPGDLINMTANGHYSWSTGGDNTCDDISVLGAWSGHGTLSNSYGVEGLYTTFMDSNGGYSAPFFVDSQYTQGSDTYVSTSVPADTAASEQIVLGYNVDTSHTMNCGTIEFVYQIIRCEDANGITYPCH